MRLRLAPEASQPPDSNDKVGVQQRLAPPAGTTLVVDNEPGIGSLLAEMRERAVPLSITWYR